ncbi:DUF2268 domain-containing protein [Bacillus velezensis]|uniref:DUF2268 domain-containing protein n=1 Tax=Bacillus velezensis TaxID=492670 RepID=UPI0024AE8839|nr:DUF2268 domain-containing protein [Bacillus velezensis]WHM03016.1 DUF2268 domain-containing protein [Bacillus velezensis]
MSVKQTYQWMEKAASVNDLAPHLLPLFSGADKKEWKPILGMLQNHGMFRHLKDGVRTSKRLKEKGCYSHIQKEEAYLKEKWNGPDVPIVVLPVDERNRKIRQEFGSKSGLAFRDKMFLFLSSDSSNSAVSALMTHEYNHVCRLEHVTKDEKDETFLDTIMMEGLAEYAVYERFGSSLTAEWTSYYTPEQLDFLFEKRVKPNHRLTRDSRMFSQLLYGKGYFPSMLGYAVGFNIVKKYLTDHQKTVKEALAIPSKTFLEATH